MFWLGIWAHLWGDPNVPKKLLLVRPGLIQNSIDVMWHGNGFSLPTGDWVWEEQPSPRFCFVLNFTLDILHSGAFLVNTLQH